MKPTTASIYSTENNRLLKRGLMHTVSAPEHTHSSKGSGNNKKADIHVAPHNSVGHEGGVTALWCPTTLTWFLSVSVWRARFKGAEVGVCVFACACAMRRVALNC